MKYKFKVHNKNQKILIVVFSVLFVVSKCLDFHLGHYVTHFSEYLLMLNIYCNKLSWKCCNVSQRNEKLCQFNFEFEFDRRAISKSLPQFVTEETACSWRVLILYTYDIWVRKWENKIIWNSFILYNSLNLLPFNFWAWDEDIQWEY